MLGFDRRAARITWTVALVAVALFAVYSIRKTLFILLLSVFFSYMVYPAVNRLSMYTPRRFSHAAATATVFAAILVLVAGFVALIGPPIAQQASALGEVLPGLAKDPNVLNRIPLPDWLAPVRERIAPFIQEHLAAGTSVAVPIAKQVGQVAIRIASNSIFLIVVPILAFLLIKDATVMREKFLAWVRGGGHGSMWTRIVDGLDVLLGRYIRSLLILSGATLTIYAIAFSVAGVPYALLLAALAGVLEFIPVIGPLGAALICLIVSGLAGYEHVLLLLGFLIVYRLFQDYVLNPYLMSDGVEVAPLLVLFGLLAGEEIGGVVGIFLSVPALAAAKIIASEIAAESRARRGTVPEVAPRPADTSTDVVPAVPVVPSVSATGD